MAVFWWFDIFHVTHIFNTLRLSKNGLHFADDIFKCVSLTENAWVSIKISLKFVPKGSINSSPPSAAYMHQWIG